MNKKEIIVSILVVGLTVLFAAVTLAVFLTKGKSKKWIAHKMKLGGLLLTLTAVSCNGGGEEAMCYSTVATNSFSMHSNSENGIEINLDTNNILKGSIYECINSEF